MNIRDFFEAVSEIVDSGDNVDVEVTYQDVYLYQEGELTEEGNPVRLENGDPVMKTLSKYVNRTFTAEDITEDSPISDLIPLSFYGQRLECEQDPEHFRNISNRRRDLDSVVALKVLETREFHATLSVTSTVDVTFEAKSEDEAEAFLEDICIDMDAFTSDNAQLGSASVEDICVESLDVS